MLCYEFTIAFSFICMDIVFIGEYKIYCQELYTAVTFPSHASHNCEKEKSQKTKQNKKYDTITGTCKLKR